VEIVPSKCVTYTGTSTVGGPIDKEFTCTPNLNDIINLFDDDLKELIEKAGISKTALDAASSTCGTTVVNTSALSTYSINDTRYSQSEVIIQLVGVICNLQKRVNYLKTKAEATDSGNVFWLDLPLDQDFKTWLSVNGACLLTQPCAIGGNITTLRMLLQTIISKICSL
jgi:hypothetical protein